MSSKQEIFEATLTSPYNTDGFITFIKEMISGIEIVAPYEENKPYNTFSAFVARYFHIGEFDDGISDSIGIFAVELQHGESIERARTAQRAFIKTLMEKGGYAGALVAFYSVDKAQNPIDTWRFSFIRMDYEFAKGRIKENLTPAKRYSYLVGKGEPCHTAMDRLFPIFMNDKSAPTLDELEEAFSVESVTNGFFELYKEKYLEMKEFLESNEDFQRESEIRGFTSEQFSKKLLSQIVFLYFIQKKGWLGVTAIPTRMNEKEYKNAFFAKGSRSRELIGRLYKQTAQNVYFLDKHAFLALDDETEDFLASIVIGQPWGTGPKNFMRRIFDGCVDKGWNFFDDYLEPLFYNALNKNRGDNAFFAPLHRRIPFLNGGLFEELDGYDWEHNDFAIPNNLFSNADTKGRNADGILDIFDRYNFTMAEDEPMEREVAIDPEMLGKVFENLLEVSDRKSKGAFYTPREIVHFMCQESLINYLVTRSGIPEDDIRKLVLYGEYFKDKDAEKTLRVPNKNGQGFHMELDKQKDFEIPETIFSYKNGTNRLQELDDLLANVKVVDPAVGSGAFPLGILNEIVKARDTLSTYMSLDMNGFERKSFYSYGRTMYDLKAETIKNCIFACDIEPSATDIAKLRLWLSLVIEDELMENAGDFFGEHSKPKQLPNLDCNVICGNSLIESFEGFDLINESDVIKNIGIGHQENLMQAGVDKLVSKLIELQDTLFYTKNHADKEEIKDQIYYIYDTIIEEQLRINPELLDKYREVKETSSLPFVLWQLYFPKVFQENGGFDICIGNPPYIQLQKTINEETGEKLGDAYKNLGFETFTKTGDIYCLFYEKGYRLLREGGVLTFITSNKWMRASYGEKLRHFFSTKTNPIRLIDFGSQKVFESATVDVNVLLFTKGGNKCKTIACTVKEDCTNNLSVYIEQNSSKCAFDFSDSWTILSPLEHSIKGKIISSGVPLSEWNLAINYGIKTGFNDAFIISGEKKDELIKADPKSAELIRPILRGRDIKRYHYTFANLWLIATFPSRNYDINDYPAIKEHLLSFGIERLEQSGKKYSINEKDVRSRKKTNNKWFETQDSISYWNEFLKQKIVYREISDAMDACLVDPNYMLNNKCYLITGDHLIYILSFLNSKLFTKIVLPQANLTGGKGEAFLKEIPLIYPTPEIESHLIDLYNKRTIDDESADRLVDSLFCDIYALTDEEREYIML